MIKDGKTLFILGLSVFIVYLPSFVKLQSLKKKNMQFEIKIAKLEKENKKLIKERKLLKEDPLYLEAFARETMGLAKEGEVIYKIVPKEGVK